MHVHLCRAATPCHRSMLSAAHSASANAGAQQALQIPGRRGLPQVRRGGMQWQCTISCTSCPSLQQPRGRLDKVALLHGGCLKLAAHPECWRPSHSGEVRRELSAAVAVAVRAVAAAALASWHRLPPATKGPKQAAAAAGCSTQCPSRSFPSLSTMKLELRAMRSASQTHLKSARIAKMQAWGRLPSHSSQNSSASEDRGFLPAAPVRGDGRRSAARQCIWALVYRLGTAPDLGSKPHLWG